MIATIDYGAANICENAFFDDMFKGIDKL